MGINLYETRTLLAAKDVIAPKASFLRDRYFPTSESDIFNTKKVNIDYKDEQNNVIAPAVLPGKGGIPVDRRGYETHEIEPPLIAPERTLKPEDLENRLAGEVIGGTLTPQQREAKILADDVQDLGRMIDLREEQMAASLLLNNEYTLKQYADKYGSSEFIEKNIKFFSEASNPATYTPGASWSTSSKAIISDLAAMAGKLTKRGLPATDVIVAGDVADVILGNDEIQKLLDNRRFELGSVKPEALPDGATLIAVLNVKGRIMNIFSYDLEYTDESKTSKLFIPSGKVVVTAPAIGRTAYGSVTQIEERVDDYVTYAGRRVPKVSTNSHDDVRTLILKAKPVMVPNVKNPFVSATVL